jgi:putative radical SAM enzyme (TIGR03279 family)
MKRFAKEGIEMHCQIVLCKNVNDGEHLDRTMNDLKALYPMVSSVSVVPAGITKYRENLFPLTPFSSEESAKVIDQVEAFANKCYDELGSRIFFCADELYISGNKRIPSGDDYEGYPQIENGVGMIRSMSDEFSGAIKDLMDYDPHRPRSCSIATGSAAYGFISSLVEELKKRCYNFDCTVYEIKNDFFGETITVAGLITARDLYRQLRNKPLGKVLFLPSVMLRREKDRFLDDKTPRWLEEKLNVSIEFVDNDGYEFVEKLMKKS